MEIRADVLATGMATRCDRRRKASDPPFRVCLAAGFRRIKVVVKQDAGCNVAIVNIIAAMAKEGSGKASP